MGNIFLSINTINQVEKMLTVFHIGMGILGVIVLLFLIYFVYRFVKWWLIELLTAHKK